MLLCNFSVSWLFLLTVTVWSICFILAWCDFKCNDGRCINKDMVCDRINNCDGGEDESRHKCSDKKRMLFFVCAWRINRYLEITYMQSLYDRKYALVLYLTERQKRLAGDIHYTALQVYYKRYFGAGVLLWINWNIACYVEHPRATASERDLAIYVRT